MQKDPEGLSIVFGQFKQAGLGLFEAIVEGNLKESGLVRFENIFVDGETSGRKANANGDDTAREGAYKRTGFRRRGAAVGT